MLDRGDFNGAIASLESKKDLISNDADAQLVLGHAYAARNDPPQAIAAYRSALEIKPERQSDRDLRANLRTMAGEKRSGDRPERVRRVGRPHQGRAREGSAHEGGGRAVARAPSRRAERARQVQPRRRARSASRRTRSICRTARRARCARRRSASCARSATRARCLRSSARSSRRASSARCAASRSTAA